MPNMMGCNICFKTQIIKINVSSQFYRVWGLAHQLNLIIKARLNVSAEAGYFSLFDLAMAIIRWMQIQYTLIQRMGSKLPYYISVKWNSLSNLFK